IYAGQEDNAFFRRDGRGLIDSGGKALRSGDVLTLGDNVIHSVTNPLTKLTAAIHVYGGDFVAKPRSQWGTGRNEGRRYDMELTTRQFAEANERWLNSGADSPR